MGAGESILNKKISNPLDKIEKVWYNIKVS